MYTRCPQCHTVFRLTSAQLKAHGGQVRCGRCQHVFRGDQHIVEPPATVKAATPPRKRAPRKTSRTAKPAAPAPVPEGVAIVPESPDTEPAPEPPAPLYRGAPARTRSFYWSMGIAALVVVLLLQGIVFYGQELVRHVPPLRDVVASLCTALPCQRLAPIDLRQLDLVETQVTPHPRYDRALRIRATMVNRADFAQPYPLLEVSLTNSQGQLVARRSYPPREYLRNSGVIAEGLPPQVAVHAQLDITSPGPQASGFEVLLVPPTD